MVSEEVTVIPKWVWMSIGVLLLAAIGGIGSAATWTMITVVDQRVMIAQQEIQINQHTARIDMMESKLDRVVDNQQIIIASQEKILHHLQVP